MLSNRQFTARPGVRGSLPVHRWEAYFPHRRQCGGLLLLAIVFATVGFAAGCSGSGKVKVVPVMRADLTDTEPLVQEVRVSEAYWDVDDQGQVVVGLKYHMGSMLGSGFDFDWQLSLVFEAMPAGSSRLYNMRSESIRVLQTFGVDQRRSRGWSGVAVLHGAQDKRLRGRFHANVRQQQFTLLSGWSPPYYQAPMLLVVGEFEAVRNPEKVHQIRQATEAAGFDRSAVRPSPQVHRVAGNPATSTAPVSIPGDHQHDQ